MTASSEDFNVLVISSIESFQRSMNASMETSSFLHLGQTTDRYFLTAFASGSGDPSSARH